METLNMRHKHLLEKAIKRLRNNQLELFREINFISSLINELNISSADKEEMNEQWFRLEIVYAVALDEKRTSLSDEDINEINSALNELQNLVDKIAIEGPVAKKRDGKIYQIHWHENTKTGQKVEVKTVMEVDKKGGKKWK